MLWGWNVGVEAGVHVHVVPAVGVAALAAFRSLHSKAGVPGDPAGCDVGRRVAQLHTMQPERLKAPRGHRRQRPPGDPTATRPRQHPVRHLGQTLGEDHTTQGRSSTPYAWISGCVSAAIEPGGTAGVASDGTRRL